ncbi:phosphoenolpyruvate carboxykinase (GTP) [Aquimonas voraii]|uniref:Phosphoenolpyruvate carboxykinase [GTP] n=1 Tax=Aquimonas voraii TaxID=265719 RepID=A0A1G7A2R9_9GAMM|nr:phosphoenolpyruvate carboxykinase (GTP) [Aquimonas voraii]SDE09204.1 phosphoenolpyruvate carboxykinase (GTP) [Aquimonas voraii]
MSSTLAALNQWVEQVARLTRPDAIHWCDGSEAERERLTALMLESGDLYALNPDTHPDCYLHRSNPSDVARVEHLTFVCTRERDEAGANNNWMAPDEARAKMQALFAGCMQGRTLYVVPYCMGPIDSPLARCGVEITDSPYVVVNMRLMTRMGADAQRRIEREGRFVKGLHSTGELDPERRFIMHFPEDLEIQSYGSGYGGNALLGKKCHALRIASHQARSEGWMAEHMLILGVETPKGDTHYVAAAFPSACGKTNLAMLIPPEGYRREGWKIFTIGDDIAWMQPGADGRLYAINPEAGFFGVAPGTSEATNPNALAMLGRNAIFTNTGVTADNQPWWEGLPGAPAKDWQGRDFDPARGPAAHPNSRFTVSARQCPSYSPESENPSGVPISAIIFGGRRASLVPLVMEAEDWTHGVLMGASMASETTAAATGAVGVVRRDPMAMKPFCGYNFADYFGHWLGFDRAGAKLPKIFHVNWFRKGADGKFLWPGFGENMRVLEWIIARCEERGEAVETPVGHLPSFAGLRTEGLEISAQDLEALLSIEADAWQHELEEVERFMLELGERTPAVLVEELRRRRALLGERKAA